MNPRIFPRTRTRGLTVVLGIVLAGAQTADAWSATGSFLAKRRFQESYRGVLERHAKGDTGAALDAMMALEERWLASDRDDRENLRRFELVAARRISRGAAAELEAIVFFHELLYREYRSRGQTIAASQARETLVALALACEGGEGDEEERQITARLLSRLGREMLASHAETMAESLFAEAVEIEPGRDDSWLCLAYLHEKRGRYERAGVALTSLLETRPGSREGRLRLALQRVRQGRELEAADLLDGLLAREEVDWIYALAAEERARLLVDSGEIESARRLLSEVRELLPCDSSLAIQEAYLRQRAGGWSIPNVFLDEILRRCAPTLAASVRDRYNRLPGACQPSAPSAKELAASRRILQRALETK